MKKGVFLSKNSGQVVILLLLIMVVALAIGLSTIGRSILEVSTSRKSEDSSRAFSAAEAAIERAMKANENNIGGTYLQVGGFTSTANQAAGTVAGQSIPAADSYALAWDDDLTKRNFAQFWLADPNNISVQGYTGNSFDIYFGKPGDDTYYTGNTDDLKKQPAIEVTVIYWNGTAYTSARKYFDSYRDINKLTTSPMPSERNSSFTKCNSANGWNQSVTINTGITLDYYCKATVNFASFIPALNNSNTTFPVLVRVRLLYLDDFAHPVALKPLASNNFPKQATVYTSDGTSGDVKRTLRVTSYKSVMPFFFDYVLFSASNLTK